MVGQFITVNDVLSGGLNTNYQLSPRKEVKIEIVTKTTINGSVFSRNIYTMIIKSEYNHNIPIIVSTGRDCININYLTNLMYKKKRIDINEFDKYLKLNLVINSRGIIVKSK